MNTARNKKHLRPYQIEGVEKLIALTAKREGAILADEPGLGKTVQVAQYINRRPELSEILIVCPASLRINWQKELDKWLVSPRQVEIVSYEYQAKHPDTAPMDLVVFDEAHYLKNPTAKRTKACLNLTAKTRLFLTGTPVVNRPMDLYPILKSLGLKMNRTDFGKRFCAGHLVLIRRNPKKYAWDFSGASNLEELNQALRTHCMVRRTKSEVLSDLPAKIRQVIELDIPHGESVQLQQAVNRMFDGMEKAAENISELKKVAFEELAKSRLDTAKNKLPYVIAYLKDLLEEEKQVVVFAHHREIIDAIANEFPSSTKLYGGMSDREKNCAVEEFQAGLSSVFVGQIQAAGTGLTLTKSHTVLFAELDWVPGNITQAEDRCHRFGQKDVVRVIHLVAKDSVDGRMVRALVAKQKIIEGVTK